MLETIFDRFPSLSDDILKYLDEKSLANCVEVDRKWQTTIANQRVYVIAKIQKWSRHSKQFSKEWNMAFVKTPLEFLRRLADYIMEYQILNVNINQVHWNRIVFVANVL